MTFENEGNVVIPLNSFQDYEDEHVLFMNIFDEAHACNSSSFDAIENIGLVCDLERKEVIFYAPLCFDGKFHILGNNDHMNVVDNGELHRKVMVMLGLHVINSKYKPNMSSTQGDGHVRASF